jgi:hypothetical protein
MSRTEKERLHPLIDRKLAGFALPPAWDQLRPQSSHEERLKVCQAIRDSGGLPEDAGYFLVCWAAEHLAEDEDSRLDDPLQTLNLFEAMRASERTFLALLERHREGPMAALFRTDPGEHDRREAGRLFFFGPVEDENDDDPGWLDQLLRAVTDGLVTRGPVDHLSYRYRPSQVVREVDVCPPAGQGWAVDIERLREAFDKIDGCGWYAAPAEEGDCPYLWVEGEFDGREVFLRVLPAAETAKGYETWRRSRK